MKTNKVMTKLTIGLLAGLISLSPAVAAEHAFSGERVTVESNKSFRDVTHAIERLVAKNGMMVMASVNQGKMLSMTGLKLNARLFVIGNPNVGKKLFSEDRGVGLYVPLRIFVYSAIDGKTLISYDKPSTLLGQFNNPKVGMVAQKLDRKLAGLANMAAK